VSRVLIVSPAADERDRLCLALRFKGYDVAGLASADQSSGLAHDWTPNVVVREVSPSAGEIDWLSQTQGRFPGASVVLLGADGCEAPVGLDAQCYLRKPVVPSDVVRAVEGALAQQQPSDERRALETSLGCGGAFAAIKGNSRRLRELLSLVARVADTDSTLLVTGETGSGKELIASAIHASSRRRRGVFSAINSAAFPETLLESELFGHRRGAFTGASENKKGLLESAHGGTVFLDEVAEMSLSMQAKLLRFLQTGEIRPVGSESSRCVDVRTLAATNKDLEQEVLAGRFRQDLYYRLAVITIEVPALRERAEDIPTLALEFLRRFAVRLGKNVQEIAPEAMELMLAYRWPGNVRELENTIQRATALCTGHRIDVADLPSRLRERAAPGAHLELKSLRVLERAHILSTLEQVGWNRRKAANILKISTTTLWRRLKEFGISPARPGAPRS
jgi:DNA-binding NtrC family response regulator